MQKKVIRFMEEHHMVEKGDCVLAAVSGGADSLCLLLVLLGLRQEWGLRLCAVHVEHGIRGEDSLQDARFVEMFCENHNVPLKIFRCKAEDYAKAHKMTLEEGARALRYGFFAQAAEEFGADKVAVAHNQEDWAETMLFHLVRGTGLKGMCGIPPVRGNIIRPLLCAGREEIEGYLSARGQSFCQDKTNGELLYARNKLRHQVFPALKEINSQAAAHMAGAACLVAEAAELVEDSTLEAAKKYAIPKEGGLAVSIGILDEKPIIQKSLLHKALSEAAGGSRDISGLHVQQLLGLFGKQPGKMLDFPYGIRAERVYEGVLLKKRGCMPNQHLSAGKKRFQRETEGGMPEQHLSAVEKGTRKEAREGSAPEQHLSAEEQEAQKETREGSMPEQRFFAEGETREGSAPMQNPAAEEGTGHLAGQFWELPVNGTLEIPAFGYEIRTKILENHFQNEEIPKKMYTKWLDYDRIKGNMHLRTRQEQDYFVISPDGRQKKLKKYFIDEKVPRQQRGQVLLLAEGPHVLWAIGGRISEDVKVTEETKRVLEIRVYGGNIHE